MDLVWSISLGNSIKHKTLISDKECILVFIFKAYFVSRVKYYTYDMIVTKSYDEKNDISIEDINQPFVNKLHLSSRAPFRARINPSHFGADINILFSKIILLYIFRGGAKKQPVPWPGGPGYNGASVYPSASYLSI